MTLDPARISEALTRIAPFIHRTPLLTSSWLDSRLGHRFIFKAEGFQKIGAFKARGAMNALMSLKENGKLPPQVCAFSSGNHAQAVAWSAAILGVKAAILIPKGASEVKIAATQAYGADVILTESRKEAETEALTLMRAGSVLIPPYDHDDVRCGQGTACLEALEDGVEADAIFAPVGGGGLISGTWLAAQAKRPEALVFGAEPRSANDAAQSFKKGQIVAFDAAPKSLADGVLTLKLSERTFEYVRQLKAIYEVTEDDIIYWTQWLSHLLKITVEPTAALGMAAAHAWAGTQYTPRTILIILSGANVSAETHRRIWADDRLKILPKI